MLKKIKILLFITITALVLPGMVHADMSAYNNVCISPGSPCAGRIADLEAQLSAPTAAPTACAATPARVADLENQYVKHQRLIADICRFSNSTNVNIIRNYANGFGVSLPPSCNIPR